MDAVTDQDGQLTYEEYNNAVTALREAGYKQDQDGPENPDRIPIKTLNEFKRADLNSDNVITIDEFVNRASREETARPEYDDIADQQAVAQAFLQYWDSTIVVNEPFDSTAAPVSDGVVTRSELKAGIQYLCDHNIDIDDEVRNTLRAISESYVHDPSDPELQNVTLSSQEVVDYVVTLLN